MAFQWILCGLTVAVLLFTEGCHSRYKDCGLSEFEGKIIRKFAADPGAWPWQVSLQRSGTHFCGATLFHEEWVMTAAHCMEGNQSQMVKAVLGSVKLSNSGSVMRNVTMVKCFPLYNNRTHENDICLLKLSGPVNSTFFVRPVCLPTKNSTFPAGQHSWVSGWFDISKGSDALQRVPLRIVGYERCQLIYGKNNTMCAGVRTGGTLSCQGDTGGPLVVKGSHWIQGGVMSIGIGCNWPGVPDVYTNVAHYQMWISNVTGMNMSDFVAFKAVKNNYTTPAPHHNGTTYMTYMTTPHMNMTTPHMNMTTPHMNMTTPHMNMTGTTHMTNTTTKDDDDKDCDNVFCSAANMVHIASVGFILALSLLAIGVA